jgi:hypothetical protein
MPQTPTLNGAQGLLKHYSAGDCFGELALLMDQPRAATVTAEVGKRKQEYLHTNKNICTRIFAHAHIFAQEYLHTQKKVLRMDLIMHAYIYVKG